jgi:hypothetical protein
MRFVATTFIVILLLISVLLSACGGNKTMNENEAIEIADSVISEDYPDMVDSDKVVEQYTSEGIEFYEMTYSRNIEVDAGGETLEIPRIVVITIDAKTKEKFIAISD